MSASTGPDSGPARAARWLKAPGILLAFVLATVWLLYPLSTSPGSSLFRASTFRGWFFNQPDITLNAWILAWDTHVLSSGRISTIFDANIFHPEPAALALSEHMLGVAPLFAPIYLATGNLALSLNLWTMATFVLCGLAMYWVCLRWLGSHMAAAVAAIAYAFAPWRFFELSHVQLLSVQYLPLLTFAVLRGGLRRDVIGWLSIFVLALIQSLSSYYLGYMGFTVASIVLATSLLLQPDERLRRLLFVGSALVSAALVMLPFSLPYLELADRGHIVEKIDLSSGWSACTGYLFPRFSDRDSHLWLAWMIFPVLALGGLIAGIATRRYRILTISIFASGIMGLWVSMGWRASVLGIRIGVIEDIASVLIPGWSALRIVNRFGIICWLAICVLAAVPFARDVRWLGSFRISRLALGVAVIASLLVSAARLDLRTEPSPEIATDLTPYRWLAEHGEGDPLLEWPMRFADRNSRYMYLSTLHWLPLVNGYSGYIPYSQKLMTSLANGLPEAEAMKSLIELNSARWLLLHRRAPDYAQRPWDQLRQEGAKLRAEGDGFQLYELPYRRDEPPLLRNGRGQEASIFGVGKNPLTRRDLRAEVVPFRKRAVDRFRMGLPVPLHIRNMGTVTWPGVAVAEAGLVGVIFRIRAAGESDYRSTRGFNRLPTDLAPGQATTVWPIVHSPRKPGDYELLPCLTQVGVELTRCFEGATIHLRIPEE